MKWNEASTVSVCPAGTQCSNVVSAMACVVEPLLFVCAGAPISSETPPMEILPTNNVTSVRTAGGKRLPRKLARWWARGDAKGPTWE